EVAELLSYEPNAFLTKILRQKADHTPDKRAVVVTGTPAVEYKGKFGILALVKIAERVQFKTFEFAFEIEDAARAVPAKPTGKAAPGPGENFSRAERGAVIRESNLSVVAACSRGRYHASARKQCEDRFYFSVNTPTGWNAFAVADGAENARHSGKGAELASVAACKYFLHYFSNKNVCDFFEKKARTLEEWSGHFAANFYNDSYFLVNKYRNGLELDKLIYSVVYKTYMTIADEVAMKSKVSAEPAALSDYDSTLTLLAFKKFDFGYFLISFLMGDGCAALFDWNGSGRVMPLGTPDSAASEGTAACLTRPGEVTPEKVKNKTFFAFAKSFETLILATDGVTDPFFQTARDFSDEKKWLKFHEETLKKGANDIKGASGLFSRNASIEEKVASLAAWIDFDSPGHNDDRAMIIIR
ncbi:MAG: protein phosphatase 2C domain-containing protein, partial [Deltaproteobacteria bacterium]|nr:protein phosphatase 2C domain-containing protein [Deltaproteobacteria bacterium]